MAVDYWGNGDYSSGCTVKLIEINSRKVVEVYVADVCYKDQLDQYTRKILDQDIKLMK